MFSAAIRALPGFRLEFHFFPVKVIEAPDSKMILSSRSRLISCMELREELLAIPPTIPLWGVSAKKFWPQFSQWYDMPPLVSVAFAIVAPQIQIISISPLEAPRHRRVEAL